MEKTFKDETMTVTECKIAKTTAPYIEIENGQRLLQMYGTLATQKANAELICTAVNSYEPMKIALHNALVTIKGMQSFMNDTSIGWRTIEQIKEAIAKAENKQ